MVQVPMVENSLLGFNSSIFASATSFALFHVGDHASASDGERLQCV
jgi:hypothetical protein